jgi:hypothetical protein
MMNKALSPAGCIVFLAVVSAYAGGEGSTVVATFLDTLNKGREVSLTDADFFPHVPQTAAPAAVLPDTVPAAVAEVPRPEAGVVPSRFSIQVLAGPNEQQIKKEKSTLAVKLSLPVSVVFEPPYYKLFVGEFSQHSEAENWCARLKDMGYTDAWIVRAAASRKTH